MAETVAFIAGETRTALEDLRGTLGEVALALEQGALMLDAGEFVSELRLVAGGAGEPGGYILSGAARGSAGSARA